LREEKEKAKEEKEKLKLEAKKALEISKTEAAQAKIQKTIPIIV